MKIEKVKKFLPNLLDKTECAIYIRNLREALNHGLVLKKVHKVIKFSPNAWLKPYKSKERDQKIILKKTFLS